MPKSLVVMGSSLGALDALRKILPELHRDFSAALVIVLHRDKEESGELLPLLESMCDLPIEFPLDKDPILTGHIYLAPPNYHLLIESDHFAYSIDEPEDYARPSIDALFESAAEAYGQNVTGIVLTGMREDGAKGIASIYQYGGATVVQTPSQAKASSMPEAALAAVPTAQVMSLEEIGNFLSKMKN
jgi:two-component system chemotaxis response regulator CheB